VTCPSVVEEYFEVVRRPKFARFRFPPPWLDELIDGSMQLGDPSPWPHLLPDPTDEVFLALAKMAGAWLVTGNLRRFPKGGRGGVTVVSPGEYLERLEGETAGGCSAIRA
jgi:predicted nucleic acid-binding protein